MPFKCIGSLESHVHGLCDRWWQSCVHIPTPDAELEGLSLLILDLGKAPIATSRYACFIWKVIRKVPVMLCIYPRSGAGPDSGRRLLTLLLPTTQPPTREVYYIGVSQFSFWSCPWISLAQKLDLEVAVGLSSICDLCPSPQFQSTPTWVGSTLSQRLKLPQRPLPC